MRKGECNITHNVSKTRLYRIWKQMRIRCNCKSNPTYKFYGGRGIVHGYLKISRQKNTRNCKYYEHDGLRMCHNDWARYLEINPSTLTERIRRHGISVALSMEKRYGKY